MDIIDKKIIELLSDNANATATEIGNAVNLSIPAFNKRVQKLKNDGVIRSFTVLTDPKKVNKPVVAFVFIVMQYGEGVDTLLRGIENDSDILECYAITGEYDYLIKICAESIEKLEDKLLIIKKCEGVMKSHTMLSLMEHKYKVTVLPDMADTE